MGSFPKVTARRHEAGLLDASCREAGPTAGESCPRADHGSRGKHPLWQWSLELVENAGPLLTGWACDNLQGTLKLATVGLLRIRKRK